MSDEKVLTNEDVEKKAAAQKKPSSGNTKKRLVKIRKLFNNEDTVEMACELLITLGELAVYEEVLKNCTHDGSRLEANYLFRPNQEWRTRALIRILGAAPEGCSLRAADVEHLDLSAYKSSLTEFPVGINRFTNLKRLSINNTRIQELPDSLAELTNLEFFSMSYSNLYWDSLMTSLPRCIGQLRNLGQLRLSGNSIKIIPSEIGELKSLRELDLSGNPLQSLPDSLADVLKLQILNLSETSLEKLPEEVGNLKSLRQLDLNSSPLKALPDTIGNLSKLETLNLSNTSLTGLPDSIGNLSKLETLDLSNTSLTALPDGIGGLNSLRTLDLEGTPMERLPVGIGQLESLETLSLPGTVKDIPKELGHLTNLREIEVGYSYDSDPVTQVILNLCRKMLAMERGDDLV
jgi:Leucine-rich repeat (LRR) protein